MAKPYSRIVVSNHDLRVGCTVRFAPLSTSERTFYEERPNLSPGYLEYRDSRSQRKFMVMKMYTPQIGSNHSVYLRELDDNTELEGWYDPIHLERISR